MNYIVFDIEATCWNPLPKNAQQEIIEIGAVKIDPYGEIIDQFKRLVRPTINKTLSIYCKNLTGIEQIEVDGANDFTNVCDQFVDWIDLSEPYLLVSWGSFDQKLMQKECHRSSLDSDWLHSYVDLKVQYPKIIGIPSPTNLDRALSIEGFRFEGIKHRALSDARNLSNIFVKYLGEWQI